MKEIGKIAEEKNWKEEVEHAMFLESRFLN